MRRIVPVICLCAAAALINALPAAAQKDAVKEKSSDSKTIAVEPAVVAPGQPITLHWYFTGDKVLVSGGRFGKGVVVTGKQRLQDTPRQTTTYKFDIWYKVPVVGPDGQTIQKQTHVQYTALAQVAKPIQISLKTYRDPHGWQVSHLTGWKHDKENLPDPANNALVFFQQEDDAVERLAVSILPMADATATQLVEKLEKSLFDNYDDVKTGVHTDCQHLGAPAILTTFSGMDHAHPGTRTQTLVLAFVKNGRGYVVSGRTKAKQFDIRRPALEKMVRSFTLIDKTALK